MTTPTFLLRAPDGTTHSPAPWSLKRTEAHPYGMRLCAADGNYIADITSPIPACPNHRRAALNQRDLRIIRSAPELLAAAEDMVRLVLELTNALRGMPGAPSLDLGGIFRLEKAEKLAAKARGQ